MSQLLFQITNCIYDTLHTLYTYVPCQRVQITPAIPSGKPTDKLAANQKRIYQILTRLPSVQILLTNLSVTRNDPKSFNNSFLYQSLITLSNYALLYVRIQTTIIRCSSNEKTITHYIEMKCKQLLRSNTWM